MSVSPAFADVYEYQSDGTVIVHGVALPSDGDLHAVPDGLDPRHIGVLPVVRLAAQALLQTVVGGELNVTSTAPPDQAATALSRSFSCATASVRAQGPIPKARSTRRTSPLIPSWTQKAAACFFRRACMTSKPRMVA